MASPGRNKNDLSITSNHYDIKEYAMNDSNTSELLGNHSMIDLEESLLGDSGIVFNPDAKSTPKKNKSSGKFSGGAKRKTRKNKKGGVKGTGTGTGTGTGKYSTQKRVGNFTAKNYTNIGKKRGLTLDQRKATKLMNMLHKNVTHTLSGGLHKDKPYDTMTINKSFIGLIGKPGTADATKKENAFYDAVRNKKNELTPVERKQMVKEAIIHQELPYGLYFPDKCPYHNPERGQKCRRQHPVHKMMYHGKYPITNAATAVSTYMSQ